MLMTHFIWQTVLKQLSVTNAKNGAITPSLTPTMQARCYNAGKWVRATWRGITNSSRHLGALLVLYLGILWMSLLGESFHVYPRLIRWDISTVYYKCFLRTSKRTHMSAHAHAR